MNQTLQLLNRQFELFTSDIIKYGSQLNQIISNSSFLVLGGAGSIGQAVTKEIFIRNPRVLHVVDISENNMAELIRDVRGDLGYIQGEFSTYILDIDSIEFDAFMSTKTTYDYILNLSALKHVRSEKDPYTLMRMINVNIFNTKKTINYAIKKGAKKYFCVSTDKAANPVNLMGGSKKIMELFLKRESENITLSTARFANVAFSDGSLLYSFNQRLQKRQPIVAPINIKRYFLTPKESGELCLMSCIFGENNDIYFPKLSEDIDLLSLADIAKKYLHLNGYDAYICETEDEARTLVKTLPEQGKWPCLFTNTDTTGEKEYEEFYTNEEVVNFNQYENIGIIKNIATVPNALLEDFERSIIQLRNSKNWTKEDIVKIFRNILPNFDYQDTGKYLDEKM